MLNSSGLGHSPVGDLCDHGKEQSDTLKDDEFHDLLSQNQLLKNDFGHNSGFSII